VRTLVVLPTFNEILNIDKMLRALRSVVPESDILVVDDGSPDGTADRATALSDVLGGIHVLRRSEKAGLGGAYRAGFAWGIEQGFDHFVEIDCDFSHDPMALPSLLAVAKDADVVIGSRYVPGGVIPQWSWSRKLLSRGGNRYASFMLNLGVEDATSGFRVYSKRCLELINYREVRADGYGFQIEMTYRARRAGARIIEVPISFTDRELGESKMSSAIVIEALVRLFNRRSAQ
jgi:dolichol-phosphate mannosyltransferase